MKPIINHPTDNPVERCCECQELIENPGWVVFDGEDAVRIKPMCKPCYKLNQDNE